MPGLAGLHDVDDYPEATTVPGLVVYRYDAPLFFANAEDVRNRVLAAVTAEPAPVEWVVLNMEANVEIDLTATDMLEELRSDLAARGIMLALARVKQDLVVYLERVGLVARIGSDHVFPTLPTALDGFRSRTPRPHPEDRPPEAKDENDQHPAALLEAQVVVEACRPSISMRLKDCGTRLERCAHRRQLSVRAEQRRAQHA